MAPGQQARRAERIEWVAGLVSALVVLTMIGFLLYEAVLADTSPPAVRAEVEPAMPGQDAAHLRYAVENAGGRAATTVTLSLIVRDGEEVVEKRTVTVGDVPAHSRVTGGLYLPAAAAGLDVELAVEGYVDP